jgi:hypothetical protein
MQNLPLCYGRRTSKLLEPALLSIIFGEAYDAPTIDEIIETAILTAGTTLLLGGSDTVRVAQGDDSSPLVPSIS